MALTTGQRATLKADILADSAFNNVPMDDDGHELIAQAYRLAANPAWVVWKTSVSTADCKNVIDWTEYIGRSVGERGAFEFMLSNGIINPSLPNIRLGIADIFSQQAGANSRAALLALAKRNANRAEKLFSTGTGSDAVPATMTFEGNLTRQDVSAARNS